MSKEKKGYGKAICTIVGLLCIFLFKFLPAPSGLNELDMQIAGIFIGTIWLWLTVSTSWPSMLVIAVLAMSPLFTSSQALAGSMGSWVTSFVLFSSCCTYALQKTGFLKRCAVWFVTRPITKKNPWMFLVMFFLGETVVGAFMSPLPTFIVFAAIAEQIFEELGYRKGDRFPNMVIFGTLAVASVSSVVTPIAHTVVTMSFSLYEQATGVAINWGVYTIYSIVIAIGIIAAIFLIMRFIYRPDLSRIKNMDTEFLKQGISKMGRQEIVSVVIFACVVVLWFLPGVVKTLDPENSLALYWSALGASVPPILGAVALCLIPVEEGKTIVTMAEAVKAAPWTAVMMVAGTMILGSALTNSEIGITTWLVGLIEPLVKNLSPMMFVAIVTLFVVVMTNFASNTVTVTVVFSFIMPLVFSGAVAGVNGAALACLIGSGASLAWATPASTGHAAVAIGTGWMKNDLMFKYGFLCAFCTTLIMAFIGYPVLSAMI